LRNHRFRLLEDVGGGEPKEAEAGVQQEILPPVVGDQAVPMGGAVVLESESVLRVVEIWAAQDAAVLIFEQDLGLGAGKAALTRSIRSRVSIGDSVAGSASSIARRKLAIRLAPRLQST
jgi:hypothetical protein